MSTASTTRTIKFISKAGTYTALIMSPSGDLFQEYSGDTSTGNVSIFPNYAEEQPTLYFVCTSSRVAEGIAQPQSINFWFNDDIIEFNAETGISTGAYAGLFRKIFPADNQPYYGLQILGNLVVIANYSSVVIKMAAGVEYGTDSDTIQATYSIPISRSNGSGKRVTIAAGDSNNFTIRAKGGSCILRARCFEGDSEITNGLTYQWYKLNPTTSSEGWAEISGATSAQYTVNEADIDTYGEYRVGVWRGAEECGYDVQGVMDASDPYDIQPNPNPSDETIDADESGNGQVTYTPKVVTRGTNIQAMSNVLFSFTVRTANGVLLNSDFGLMQNSFSVTREMCEQAGGDVSLTIVSSQILGGNAGNIGGNISGNV